MFDFESKINALVENYGLSLILEQKEISEFHVIKLLVENDLVDLNKLRWAQSKNNSDFFLLVDI